MEKRIFITSDTHFGHEKIREYERNIFSTTEEHDDFIMKKLEDVLKKDDILYHLGDVGFMSEDIEKRFIALPCKKILILGNHDMLNKEFYLTHGFDEVYEFPIYIRKRVVLSHRPIPVTPGTLNIHGHLHASYINDKNHFNANISVMDYKLLTDKKIDKILGSLPVDDNRFLHEWFADKYTFTTERTDVIYDKNGLVDLKASLELRETTDK